MAAKSKYVYSFGGGKAEGKGTMRELLGGKGANLAEMAGHPSLRLPVPPGFTISTDVCTHFYKHRRKYPTVLKKQVEAAIKKVERLLKKKFGDPQNPLLFSVRSGARSSMPGMMETVLNVGLNAKTIPGLIEKTGGNERFVYDAYRRLIVMYSDVVMEKAAGIEPAEDQGIRRKLEHLLEEKKKSRGVTSDVDLTGEDLKELCEVFKETVRSVLGSPFPDDPMEQLWGGVSAVFSSWNGKRAIAYRNIEGIPHEWGTAVNVQAMVFGNMGEDCSTGVAFTRNPGTGENCFYGEYLINAQGEDVVAGIRTPGPINEGSKSEQNASEATLEEVMPKAYKKLNAFQKRLEKHYRDMQDIEFTIEAGELFMLQCRVGKRNGPAAVQMALDMKKQGLITRDEAIRRVTPAQLDELLHPILDPLAENAAVPFAKGLPAGPGGATGQIVFTADDAVAWQADGKEVVLVREETNPEDVEGMRASEAVLTARGGMTSHAALVARGWGKCCVVGCAAIEVDLRKRTMNVDGTTFREGDWVSLNGSRGNVYSGQLPMVDATEGNDSLDKFLKFCDGVRRLQVRANADTPEDAARARSFGAQGIGLFRTEHMFYGKGAEAPLSKLRKMIFSQTPEQRKGAIQELFPYLKKDVKATIAAMDGMPVTIRLLDPPLHEFVPQQEEQMAELAESLGMSVEDAQRRADVLHEVNPMMGHRGVRLGVTFPEVTEMQARAIFEAAAELVAEGKKAFPEIMVPVVSAGSEFNHQVELIQRVYELVCTQKRVRKIPHLVGTMVEIPRAALTCNQLAETAEFISFGTNDLTQMTFGFSRDDIGAFLPDYLERGLLPEDPFQSIDRLGVGELVEIGIERGRGVRPKLKVGICGEHGGEAKSVKFCHAVGMDYVSCSPFRVPIARLAAAQAVLEESDDKSRRKKSASKPKSKGKAKAKTKKKTKTKTKTKTKSKIKKKTKSKAKSKAGSKSARKSSSKVTKGKKAGSKRSTAKKGSRKSTARKSTRRRAAVTA